MECQNLVHALQDLSTSIQNLATPPDRSFVLHYTQCLCLTKSYAVAVEYVHHILSTRSDLPAQEVLVPSLSELHHAMLQGRKFMHDCLNQDGWVKKSLVLALSTEAQDVCLHDLVCCLYAIHQALAFQDDDVYDTLNVIWAETSHEEDLRILLDALKHQIASWKRQLADEDLSTSTRKGINAQSCLAEFLSQRLSSENENASAPFYALPECFWVNHEEITIKGVIGEGSYGLINEVEWHGGTFGQKVFSRVGETLFARETAIQARLRHPNLLQLICCSKTSRNQCSLVMELMDMDLRSKIDDL